MKKHLHNSLRVLFLSLAVLLSLPMLAEKVEIDGINYDLVAETKQASVIEKSSGNYSGEVVIPESVVYQGNAYSVTSIGEAAFKKCSGLTSVTIPNSVTWISQHAFDDCSGLTSVTIPNSVTGISHYAFYKCSGLTSVTIPNSVTWIGQYAFSVCSGLTSVTIGNGVTSIGMYAFTKCPYLLDVYCYAEKVPSTDSGAFNGSCQEDATLHVPDASISSYKTTEPWSSFGTIAFINKEVMIDGIRYYLNAVSKKASVIAKSSGKYSGEVVIPESVEHEGTTYSVTSIGEKAFYECSGMTSVTIPNSVTSIGYAAFSDCSGLTSVTIPNSVTSIGDNAFEYCSGLTSVTIPNSVTSIGDGAFYNCKGLTSVTIGSSVKSIGEEAFRDCIELIDVYCYAEKVPSTYSDAFDGSYPEYATLHVPDASINSYRTTEPWSAFGTITSISGTVIPLPNITLTDGEEFENYIEQTVSCITYSRTLSKTNTWNALYVPFEIPMTAEFCQNYDVAYFNDVHCYDNYVGEKENGVLGQDGVIDGMDMEVLKAQEGSVLNANYPYLIRAKNTDALNMNIEVEDATLYSAKETTISCSSVFMKFDVTGIYTTQTAGELKGEYDVYAISGGGWKQALNANQQLKPFRLYLKLTSIDGSPVKATEGAMSRINIRVQGEDTETDIDELKGENGNVKTEIFDLSGRRVQKAQRGIFIQNGKKVIM